MILAWQRSAVIISSHFAPLRILQIGIVGLVQLFHYELRVNRHSGQYCQWPRFCPKILHNQLILLMWARGRAVGGGAGTGMDFLLSQPMLSFFRSLRIGTKEGQSAHFISSSSHGHLPLYWQNTYTCKLPLIKYVAHSMKEMNNAVLYPLLFTCCGACLSHNTSMISTPKEHFCSKIVNIN